MTVPEAESIGSGVTVRGGRKSIAAGSKNGVDRDGHFVQMPFVVRLRQITADTFPEMTAKAVDPLSDRFPTDRHTAFREQIFNIGSAERKTKVLQARHLGRHLYAWGLTNSDRATKLAMRHNGLGADI